VLLTGALSTAITETTTAAAGPTVRQAPNPAPAAVAPSAPAPEAARPVAAPPTRGWRIQVGAFRSPGAAQAQLRAAERLVPELARLSSGALQSEGEVVRARYAGIAEEKDARRLCGRIVETGGQCFVVPPDS
jgi:hypothetical protein